MKKFSITLGNFDGVHRGHQKLLREASEFSERVRAVTFHPHPGVVLNPELAPQRLMDYEDQKEALKAAGVEVVEVIPFNRPLASLSGEDFFNREILSRDPVGLTVGENFRFGRGRSCGVEELRIWCQGAGIQFRACSAELLEGRRISSTWVRECLLTQNFMKAEELLGRPFRFSGTVVHGKKLGRSFGFPTANLELAPERRGQLPLSYGVYAGRSLDFGDFVMNVGQAPTVNSGGGLKVEIHFFRSPGDIYGVRLEVEPHFFLRPEKKFSSVEELRDQIQWDCSKAQELLSRPMASKARPS